MSRATRHSALRHKNRKILEEFDRKDAMGEVLSAEEIEQCREAVRFFEDHLGDREMEEFYALRRRYALGLINKVLVPR